MNAFAFGDAQTQMGRIGEVCNYAPKSQVFYLFDFFLSEECFYRMDFLSELNVRLWSRSPSLPTEGELNGSSIHSGKRKSDFSVTGVCLLFDAARLK